MNICTKFKLFRRRKLPLAEVILENALGISDSAVKTVKVQAANLLNYCSYSPMRRQRLDYKYFLKYRTRWSDNDQYAHMNNAVYYYLIDSIVNTYLEEHCGCSPKSTSSRDAAPPIGLVISSQCTFFSPLSFPQVIVLGLRVSALGRSSVTYEVGFFPRRR